MQASRQSKNLPKSYWDAVASRASDPEIERPEKGPAKNWLAEYADKKTWDLILNAIEEFVVLRKNLRILDVGCGPGKWATSFAKKHVFVTGIDWSSKMMKLAKKKANLKGLKNVDFSVMDASNLQFCDEIFDLVSCITVLQHIFDDQKWKKAIDEMVRVTKTCGYIIIYEAAPLFTPKRYTPHLCIRRMGEYVFEFGKIGARLVSWHGTDLSFPLTVYGLQKYASSFSEKEVCRYGDTILSRFLSFLSKLIVVFAKPMDYQLAGTALGILSPGKIMLFRKGG